MKKVLLIVLAIMLAACGNRVTNKSAESVSEEVAVDLPEDSLAMDLDEEPTESLSDLLGNTEVKDESGVANAFDTLFGKEELVDDDELSLPEAKSVEPEIQTSAVEKREVPSELSAEVSSSLDALFGDDDDDMFQKSPPKYNMPENGQNVQIAIDIFFKDVVNGCKRSFDIKLTKPCPECNGTGIEKNSQPTKCPHCNGKGRTIKTMRNGFMMQQIISDCPHCNGSGYEVKYCKECGDLVGERAVYYAIPTCKTEGTIKVTCKYCNYEAYETVDTVGHKIDEDAKCEYYTMSQHKAYCVFCGDFVKLDHTWSDWEITLKPTAGKKGEKVRICSGCGYKDVVAIDTLTLAEGDVNGDGKVTGTDASIVLRYVAELKTLTEEEKEAADVSGDGKVTATDASIILQYVAGIRTEL